MSVTSTKVAVAGTGDDIAEDLVGALRYQLIKLAFGVAGTGTMVDPAAGLPIAGAQSAVSSTAWTSATGGNTANSISVAGMSVVSVGMVSTSTITGGVLTFEVSPDGTNWLPIAMAPIDRFGNDLTYTIVASTSRGWSTSVDGFTNFRVRLSTVIAGTGTVNVHVIAQAMAIEPLISAGIVALPRVSTSTDISLASSASTAQLVAANTARLGMVLTNTDANPAYIYFGTTATLTKFSHKINSGERWVMDQPIYTGRIDAIWAADGAGSLIGSDL